MKWTMTFFSALFLLAGCGTGGAPDFSQTLGFDRISADRSVNAALAQWQAFLETHTVRQYLEKFQPDKAKAFEELNSWTVYVNEDKTVDRDPKSNLARQYANFEKQRDKIIDAVKKAIDAPRAYNADGSAVAIFVSDKPVHLIKKDGRWQEAP